MLKRHFKNGVLVLEIRDGVFITENLGKTPSQIPRAIHRQGLRPNTVIPDPIPREDWPIWAKALAMLAKPEDKGIGDIVARTIGAENSEAFKKWFKATTGKDCGCTGRQRRLNIEYPLPPENK